MEQPASFSYGMECEYCSSELIEAEQQLDEDWETYLKWNKAVAEVIWKPEFVGKPVYLDFEEEHPCCIMPLHNQAEMKEL